MAIHLSLCICLFFAVLTVTLACNLNVNVKCSSIGYQYAQCKVSGTGSYTDIGVVEKYSKSSCVKGTSYGIQSNYIWVNKGCRALFQVFSCQKHKSMECASQKYKYAECRVTSNGKRVTHVQVASRKSKSKCTEGISYGIDGGNIWVYKGCRAVFLVCYE